MSAPAVEFRSVSKRYGAVTALDAISLSIERGTLVTLLGPSGCGKTTILRLIAGLEQASDGRILIEGDNVTLLSAAERDVSMVFQSYALFPHMTVLENVCYGLRASGMRKVRAVELAQAKLALVGLAGYDARLPSELSGGQQQRVAVARAIALETDRAELSIRPHALQLSRGTGGLHGHVAKSAYFGSHMEYWIAIAGLDKELFVVASDVEAPLGVGDIVTVTLAHSGVALVPQR